MNILIKEQFNKIAREYDSERKKFIPCFDDFYGANTDLIAANIPKPSNILDLGAGTGLLSMYYYRHFPDSKYVLVDIANEMLDVARRRFAGCSSVQFFEMDYSEFLPLENFDLIISALSIHHLENNNKARLFQRIYDKLPNNGLFINYDQFCADSPEITESIDSDWIAQLHTSGLSEAELLRWSERRKLDRECSTSIEISMLELSGFSPVNCLYSNRKFSVISAKKKN